MTPDKNERLMAYYDHKRTVWKLNDDAQLTLLPYHDSKAQPLVYIQNVYTPST